jgi:3-dehydroquinate dehydratase/shikimate dehydrogenase
MGEFGLASRILCGKYGSPLTYASYQKSRELAPGQLTFADLKDLYRFDTINRETMVLGVLGDTTEADAISRIHNSAFAKAGLDAVCVPLCVPADGLAAALVDLQWLALRGYVVAEPYLKATLHWPARSENVVGSPEKADSLPCDERSERHATATNGDAAATNGDAAANQTRLNHEDVKR